MKWIRFNTRRPTSGILVLASTPDGDVGEAMFFDDNDGGHWMADGDRHDTKKFEWWMEVPLSPVEKKPVGWVSESDLCLAMDNQLARPFDYYERRWCINEAVSCGEGLYAVEELIGLPQNDLAREVITAYSAYVNSNCL